MVTFKSHFFRLSTYHYRAIIFATLQSASAVRSNFIGWTACFSAVTMQCRHLANTTTVSQERRSDNRYDVVTIITSVWYLTTVINWK